MMRVLIDIGHPAHVLFFKNPIRLLKQEGHSILVTSRDKEVAHNLLKHHGIEHISLTSQKSGSPYSLARELLTRNIKLYRQARFFKPDVMAGVGGVFISHVGKLTGTPSLVFYDTENATLQNAITYPFATAVFAPRCYQGWLPKSRSFKYAGYHELSYLAPRYFVPDFDVAVKNGLSPGRDTFLVRIVSWKANHDIGQHGWNFALLDGVIERLSKEGKVIISSERGLPERYSDFRYSGDPACIHHVMARCRAYIGESATMASESAVLGVPAVYAATTGRGYTDEQEEKYGLVRNVRILEEKEIEKAVTWALNYNREDANLSRGELLSDTIDVPEFVADRIRAYSKDM